MVLHIMGQGSDCKRLKWKKNRELKWLTGIYSNHRRKCFKYLYLFQGSKNKVTWVYILTCDRRKVKIKTELLHV